MTMPTLNGSQFLPVSQVKIHLNLLLLLKHSLLVFYFSVELFFSLWSCCVYCISVVQDFVRSNSKAPVDNKLPLEKCASGD